MTPKTWQGWRRLRGSLWEKCGASSTNRAEVYNTLMMQDQLAYKRESSSSSTSESMNIGELMGAMKKSRDASRSFTEQERWELSILEVGVDPNVGERPTYLTKEIRPLRW